MVWERKGKHWLDCTPHFQIRMVNSDHFYPFFQIFFGLGVVWDG